MTMMGMDKPSLVDVLEHHGVKGQKWGVRKEKPTNTDIHNARAMNASRVRAINAQIDKTNLASGKKQTQEAKKLGQMQVSHLKNPDRATALRMTSAEKILAATAAVVLPGPGTVGVAAGVGIRVASRRSVEKYLRANGVIV